MKKSVLILLVSLCSSLALAQISPVDERGRPIDEIPTGRKAADAYMNREVEGRSAGSDAHFMTIHIGPYVDSQVHNWGVKHKDNEGMLTAAVSYRVGEWVNSTDFLFRLGVDTVEINKNTTTKLSLMPMISFPDARAQFPLYFGAGLGLGIFLDQVDDESSLSLDYNIMLGVRFFDVLESFGLMLEVGLNNHIFLTSKGQFSGTYVALGTVFEF